MSIDGENDEVFDEEELAEGFDEEVLTEDIDIIDDVEGCDVVPGPAKRLGSGNPVDRAAISSGVGSMRRWPLWINPTGSVGVTRR